jgi:hypothetical protein
LFFFEAVPPFPPGEQVILNNGCRCIVKEVDIYAPCRPFVIPIDLDALETTPSACAPAKEIPLSKHPALFMQSVNGYNVTKYLY